MALLVIPWLVTGLLCNVPTLAAAKAEQTHDDRLEVVVITVSGQRWRGVVRSLGMDDGLVLRTAAKEDVQVATDELVRLESVSRESADALDGFRVQTAHLDTIVGRLAWSEDREVLRVVSPDVGQFDVSLEDLLSVQRCSTGAGCRVEIGDRRFRPSDVDGDRIVTSNGDTLTGFVVGVVPKGLVMDLGSGEVVIAFAHIVALEMNNPAVAPKGKRFHVEFKHGSGIATKHLSLQEGVLSLLLPGGRQVAVNAQQVRTIEVVGARWVWLPTLEPISHHNTPMLSLSWPTLRDRNVLGGRLRIAGKSFVHGLGVHSRSNVSYDLGGAYSEFVTSFGLDDSAGSLADVDVSILVDGRRVFERRGVVADKQFGPIRIDVSQANHLELLVDYGRHGGVQDRFNWVEPGLVRQ